jgi:hypothetical protein
MMRRFLTRPIPAVAGEAFAWVLPVLFALAGYVVALPKATLPASGPGVYIALMNERTLRAQRLWEYLHERTWLFGLYAAISGAVLVMLIVFGVPPRWRWLCWLLVALPGCWHFREMIYLGGKILASG